MFCVRSRTESLVLIITCSHLALVAQYEPILSRSEALTAISSPSQRCLEARFQVSLRPGALLGLEPGAQVVWQEHVQQLSSHPCNLIPEPQGQQDGAEGGLASQRCSISCM
jgi:hypothetical protein